MANSRLVLLSAVGIFAAIIMQMEGLNALSTKEALRQFEYLEIVGPTAGLLSRTGSDAEHCQFEQLSKRKSSWRNVEQRLSPMLKKFVTDCYNDLLEFCNRNYPQILRGAKQLEMLAHSGLPVEQIKETLELIEDKVSVKFVDLSVQTILDRASQTKEKLKLEDCKLEELKKRSDPLQFIFFNDEMRDVNSNLLTFDEKARNQLYLFCAERIRDVIEKLRNDMNNWGLDPVIKKSYEVSFPLELVDFLKSKEVDVDLSSTPISTVQMELLAANTIFDPRRMRQFN